MLDVLKYFELILQLLEIEVDVDAYIKIAKHIETNPNKNYVFLHRYAFLFQSFLELTLGKLDVEEFTKIGDVHSKKVLYSEENDSVLFLDKLKSDNTNVKLLKNSVVILDVSVWNIYQDKALDALFVANNVELLTC